MAWLSAEIAVMGAEGACNIVYRQEIANAEDPAAKRSELAAAYEEQFNNPYFAASILDAFKAKTQIRLPKKHNNIPL